MPDLKNVAEQARKLDEMLEKGNDADLEKALAELGNDLRGLRKMLDQNADGFGAERFPQENRVVAELMKKIGDIEGDERALQKETQAAGRQAGGRDGEAACGADRRVHQARGREGRAPQAAAGRRPVGDPESALAEELERARDSAKQMRRLLGERDLGRGQGRRPSAPRAAWNAPPSTWTRSPRRGGRASRRAEAERDKRAEAVGEARALAQEIADDLGEAAAARRRRR